DALRVLLNSDQSLTVEAVEHFVRSVQEIPPITEVEVKQTELSEFDSLLDDSDMELSNEFSQGCEDASERAVEAVAAAGDSGQLRSACSSGGEGDAQLRAIPTGVDDAGERASTRAADRASAARLEAAAGQ